MHLFDGDSHTTGALSEVAILLPDSSHTVCFASAVALADKAFADFGILVRLLTPLRQAHARQLVKLIEAGAEL